MQRLHHDPAALIALVGDDPAAVDEVLTLFSTSARDWRAATVAAMAARDGGALAQLGHRMKSSARAIGAWGLGAACEALERDAEIGARALPSAAHALAALDAVLEELQRDPASQMTRSTSDRGRENR